MHPLMLRDAGFFHLSETGGQIDAGGEEPEDERRVHPVRLVEIATCRNSLPQPPLQKSAGDEVPDDHPHGSGDPDDRRGCNDQVGLPGIQPERSENGFFDRGLLGLRLRSHGGGGEGGSGIRLKVSPALRQTG